MKSAMTCGSWGDPLRVVHPLRREVPGGGLRPVQPGERRCHGRGCGASRPLSEPAGPLGHRQGLGSVPQAGRLEDPAPFAYKQHWGEAAVFRGKMEALAGVRSYLEEIRRDYVVLMDGDLVVNLPLSDIYDQHIKSGADITVVCGNDSFETENGTYFELDGTGRVTDVLYHLHRPRGYRGWKCTSSPPGCCWIWWTSAPPGSVQPAAGRAPGPEGQPEAPGIHLGRLRGADPLCTGVLRPQYAAAGPGHPGGAVLRRAAHPGQGH